MRGFLLLTLVAVVFASEKCGENEHFKLCGTACPLTCENYDNPPKFCILRCDSGCFCDKGFIRASDGRCVRPEECPSSGPIPKEQNCEDEPEAGMCLAYMPMWYYDASAQTCREFIYGGCQGNGNRYSSEEECMQKCGRSSSPSACLQEKEVGPCRAAFPRFYFNKETGKCEQFTFGGCRGNSNNFHSQDDCESVCKRSSAPSACLQEKEVGSCKAAFRRFYFNKETGNCEQFIYGGCDGNSNNFSSQDDCEAVCKG